MNQTADGALAASILAENQYGGIARGQRSSLSAKAAHDRRSPNEISSRDRFVRRRRSVMSGSRLSSLAKRCRLMTPSNAGLSTGLNRQSLAPRRIASCCLGVSSGSQFRITGSSGQMRRSQRKKCSPSTSPRGTSNITSTGATPDSTDSIAPHPLVALSIPQEFACPIEEIGPKTADSRLTTSNRMVGVELASTIVFFLTARKGGHGSEKSRSVRRRILPDARSETFELHPVISLTHLLRCEKREFLPHHSTLHFELEHVVQF